MCVALSTAMTITLREPGADDVLLVAAHHASAAQRAAAMPPGLGAAWVVLRCAARLDLRTLGRIGALAAPGGRGGARAALEARVRDAIERGLVLAIRMRRRRVVVVVDGGREDMVGPAEPTSWIELEVLDDLGVPLADEPYEIVTGDGRLRTGTLDGNGRAREEGIAPEDCQVRLPRLHEWKAA